MTCGRNQGRSAAWPDWLQSDSGDLPWVGDHKAVGMRAWHAWCRWRDPRALVLCWYQSFSVGAAASTLHTAFDRCYSEFKPAKRLQAVERCTKPVSRAESTAGGHLPVLVKEGVPAGTPEGPGGGSSSKFKMEGSR